MGFSLSKLWVEIAAKRDGFDRAIDDVDARMRRSASGMAAYANTAASALEKAAPKRRGNLDAMIGGAVGALSVQAAAQGGNLLRGTIGAASDLAETVSMTETVFGKAAGSMQSEAERMARSFGLSKREYLEGAAGIAMMGKAAGQTNDEAAKMGNGLANLAADASSMRNIPLADALAKIRSGLAGEAEPLRTLGVFLTETKVQQEAVAMGASKTGKDLDEQTKVMARASIVAKELAYVKGDLANTAGSAGNQFRKLSGALANIGADIGSYFLPMATAATVGLNGWIEATAGLGDRIAPLAEMVGGGLTAAWETMQSAGRGWLEIIGRFPAAWNEAFGPGPAGALTAIAGTLRSHVLVAIEGVAMFMRNLPDYWDVAVMRITQGVMNISEWIGVLPANFAILGNYIANNWRALVMDGLNAVATGFQNFIANLTNLGSALMEFLKNPTGGLQFNWTPLLDGFEATAAKLPEMAKPHLTSLQDQIDAKLQAIGEREAKRVETMARKSEADVKAASPMKGEGTAVPTKPGDGKKDEFKSESFGAAEFARKLQASITGGADKTPQKQLDSLKAIEKATVQTAKAVNKPKVAVLG